MALIGKYPRGKGELYTIKHALLTFYLFPKTQVCFLFIYTLVWREGVSRPPASPVSSPSLFSRLPAFSPFPIAKYCAFLHQRLLTFFVRKGRGRELGRETTREGRGRRGTPKFPLPLPLLTPATQAIYRMDSAINVNNNYILWITIYVFYNLRTLLC